MPFNELELDGFLQYPIELRHPVLKLYFLLNDSDPFVKLIVLLYEIYSAL